MQYLAEAVNSIRLLTEEATEGKPKKYYIEGIYLQSELVNNNGRKYPKEIMKREVDKYINEKINKNRALGELGHPSKPEINYAKASHKIISLVEDGNDYIGKAVIMNTPRGKIVKGLIDEDVCLGVSSRALGSVKATSNGVNVVCEDFMLITPADIVYDPSAPDAFVTSLMENKEWVWQNGILVEHEKQIKDNINTESKRGLNEKKLLDIFNDILNKYY